MAEMSEEADNRTEIRRVNPPQQTGALAVPLQVVGVCCTDRYVKDSLIGPKDWGRWKTGGVKLAERDSCPKFARPQVNGYSYTCLGLLRSI
jgi:hypothetical protein